MRKRRRVLVILGLITLAAVCLVMLWPTNEPKYQGVYFSEWLRRYSGADAGTPDQIEAKRAILAVGTNGLPYYLKQVRSAQQPWQSSLHHRLPQWLQANGHVRKWLGVQLLFSSVNDFAGLQILGTNAVSIIPELTATMADTNQPASASVKAIHALACIGEPAFPVLQAAFADPNQPYRRIIAFTFGDMVRRGHTNACLPSIIEALNDGDSGVRTAAAGILREIAPQLLTNAPANQTSAPPQ